MLRAARLLVLCAAACSANLDGPTDGGGGGAGSADAGLGDAGSGGGAGSAAVFSQCIVTAAPYNADPTGATDATAAFQRALDACYDLGGGVVYAPAGRYTFRPTDGSPGAIAIPEGVTLRGDFTPPTDEAPAVTAADTVLEAYEGSANFIQLLSGAGVEDLVVWYPDQTIGQGHYPATIAVAPVASPKQHINARSMFTVTDVELVNSSIAIDLSPPDDGDGNDEGAEQAPRVRRVWGSPLDEGVYLAGASATPFLEQISFAPAYWAASGLLGAPAAADIAAYTRQASIGIDIGGEVSPGAHAGGAGYTAFADLEDYATGVRFYSPTVGANGTDPHLFGVTIAGGTVGVEVDAGTGDMDIANSDIRASGSGAAAIYVHATTDCGSAGVVADAGTLRLDDVTLASDGAAVDVESASYDADISQSQVLAWGGVAIIANGPNVVVQATDFAQPLGSGSHVTLGSGVTTADFLSDTVASGDQLAVDAPRGVHPWIEAEPYPLFADRGFDAASLRARLPAQPQPARLDAGSVIVVAADTSDGSDTTSAIQAALDAAGAQGGGTVYVPGGIYKLASATCTSLHVPAGVELLGANGDSPFFANAARTLLDAAPDPACPRPLVTLDARAGVRGLMIFYSQQNGTIGARVRYPYAIAGGGPGDWIVNVAIGGAWDGIDLASAADTSGHYVADLHGFAFDNLLAISHSTSGTILDYTFSPGYWGRATNNPHKSILAFPVGSNDPTGCDENTGSACDVYAAGEGLRLGDATNELLLDVFSHAPYTGIATYDDGAGGPSFTLVDYGTETYNAFHFGAVGSGGIVGVGVGGHTLSNTNYPTCNAGCNCNAPCEPQAGAPYVIADATVPSNRSIDLFGASFGAYTPVGLQLDGGALTMQQYLCGTNAPSAYQQAGFELVSAAQLGGDAALVLSGAVFAHQFPTLIDAEGSSSASLAASSIRGALVTTGDVDTTYEP